MIYRRVLVSGTIGRTWYVLVDLVSTAHHRAQVEWGSILLESRLAGHLQVIADVP
jgi:hypothetical protein